MRFFQHVVEFSDRDGIGNDVIGLQNRFLQVNHSAFIVTPKSNTKIYHKQIISPENLPEFQKSDVHILHYGGMGYPVDLFLNIRGKKVLKYHNITPPFFFRNYLDSEIYKDFQITYEKSIFELETLLNTIDEVWYDSVFNRNSLMEEITVSNKNLIEKIVPISFLPGSRGKSDSYFPYRLITVSRWVPHKKFEDLILILAYLKKIDSRYELILLGKQSSIFEKYKKYLDDLIRDLDLEDSISWIENTGDEEKIFYYNSSLAFLSMSEHEGFGVPILEAFQSGIPVLAFSAGAVRETMRGGGVLIHKKEIPLIAEFVHRLQADPDLRMKLVSNQFRAFEYYRQFRFSDLWRNEE